MWKFIFILFISSSLFAQQNGRQAKDPVIKKYKFAGKIVYTSFHQGGAPVPDEYQNIQYPKANFTILIVQYLGQDLKPKIWDRVTTDEKGNFETEVPNGEYGFLLVDELKNANPGQYLPEGYESEQTHTYSSSSWEIVGGGPIKINGAGNTGVLLINHQRSVCMDCP